MLKVGVEDNKLYFFMTSFEHTALHHGTDLHYNYDFKKMSFLKVILFHQREVFVVMLTLLIAFCTKMNACQHAVNLKLHIQNTRCMHCGNARRMMFQVSKNSQNKE